jgi:hypothetical protein
MAAKNSNIVLVNSFNVESLGIQDQCKKLDTGAILFLINNKDNKSPLYLQTREMNIPFDLGVLMSKEDPTLINKVTLSLSLKDQEVSYNTFKNIDEAVLNWALNNPNIASYYKKGIPDKNDSKACEKYKDFILDRYKSFLRHSIDPVTKLPDGKYPSTIQAKVPYVDKKINVPCFENGNEFDLNTVLSVKNSLKGGFAKAIIHLSGIIVTPASFSIMAKVVQVLIKLPLNKISFIQDDDEEDELNTNDTPAVTKVDNKVQSSDDEEDDLDVKNKMMIKDDSEDEDDEEVEEEPQPKKKAVKKVVKK